MIQVINKTSKTAQIVLKNQGKSITKHLKKDSKGRFVDKKGIPYFGV